MGTAQRTFQFERKLLERHVQTAVTARTGDGWHSTPRAILNRPPGCFKQNPCITRSFRRLRSGIGERWAAAGADGNRQISASALDSIRRPHYRPRPLRWAIGPAGNLVEETDEAARLAPGRRVRA